MLADSAFVFCRHFGQPSDSYVHRSLAPHLYHTRHGTNAAFAVTSSPPALLNTTLLIPCLVLLIGLNTSAGGYIPSSSSADDYMAQLKADSRQKNREKATGLSGRETPAEVPGASGAKSGEVRTSLELSSWRDLPLLCSSVRGLSYRS